MKSSELLVMAYLDNALNRLGRRAVERRLAAEPALRSHMHLLKDADHLAKLAVDSAAEASNVRAAALLSDISLESKNCRHLGRWSTPAVWLLLAVAVIVITLSTLLHGASFEVGTTPATKIDATKVGHRS